MSYSINTLNPNPKDLLLLTKLFNQYPLLIDFRRKTKFPIDENDVILSHTLIVLNRSDGVFQCAVIDKYPFSHGGCSAVFHVINNFSLQNNRLMPQKPFPGEMICKSQRHSDDSVHEFEMSQRADHLAVYPNYLLSTQYIDTLSYLFLKKQPGKEFYYLLIPVNAWRPNIQTRFKLSIKLLTALKEQVHDQGLVHRDIKPENILVAIEKNVIQVNIIDFAFACPLGEQPLFGVGTPDFIAPECYKPEGNILSELPTADYTIDVYAMAIVLKELWASDKPPISVLTNENLDEYLKPIHANSLAGENLSFVEYVTLFRIILAMAEPRPENRISLTQAIEHITSLMTSVFERHKLEAFERTQKQRLSAQRYKLTKIVPEPTESVEIGSLSHSTASVHNHTASSEQKTGRPWCSFFKKAIFCCTKHNSQVLPVEHVSSAARVTTLELHPNL